MAGNQILLHIRSTTTSKLFFNLLQLIPLFRMPHFDEDRECALLRAIKIVQDPDVPSNEHASKEAYEMVKDEAETHLEWLLAEDHRTFSKATFLWYNLCAEPLRREIRNEPRKWRRLLAAITYYWTNQAGGRNSRPPSSRADQ